VALVTAALVIEPFGFPSQAMAQPLGFEMRAGITRSTALAEDAVANIELEQLLGLAFLGGVTARPATALTLALSALIPLRQRTLLDVSLNWTFSRLHAEDVNGRRPLQRLGVGQIGVGIRYKLHPRIDTGCGFGAVRYFADETGLFATGSQLTPMLECGAGVTLAVGPRAIVVRVFGQAQRFRTPALRDAGARTGSVFRFGAQAGIALGGAQ
jgi:hypothetical protein